MTENLGKKPIALVDDHAIVREGLAQLVNATADLEVIGTAGNAAEALELIGRTRPMLAIVDLSLGGKPGIELIKELTVQYPQTAVLVLSMHDEQLYAERTMRAGARGYIMKGEASEQILAAARRVLGGEIYLSERMSSGMLQQLAGVRKPMRSGVDLLSDRELEVFELIGSGKVTREIAAALNVSPKTVEAHREHIKHKLNLNTCAEVIRHAVQYSIEQV